MKKYLFLILLQLVILTSFAQVDTSLFKTIAKDTSYKNNLMNMDAVYSRPFLNYSKSPVSIGGYLEANYQHLGTNGISEGHQFQMRRMTLFIASSIKNRIKFLSEIEFEDGTKEINIEFAAVDFTFNPMINIRGGILMNPIGAFNQNHDGPKWEFIDRPISATQMLPATWSNVGFGLYGKKYSGNWIYAYEVYLTNGFDDRIIANNANRTNLAATKANKNRFEESPNGEPLYTGKFAIRNRKIGELGLSYMGGIYNKFQIDGFNIDKKRSVHTFAIDFNTTLPVLNTKLIAEWAMVVVDVPPTYSQQFGDKQYGGFLDVVQPVFKKQMQGFHNAVLNLACRFEFVDWNVATFRETGGNIADHIWAVVPAVSFRPSQQTVIRINYRYQQQTDLLGNIPLRTGGFQIGFSTYF
ncbi:MAG: hypothetical protein H7296_09755 [Bacteroidia bacterium]|nr:hypothetical protein [Bacteroidia bacterium]